jgi:hypothetical protein
MQVDPQAQLVELCERLLAATIEQQLEWEPGEKTAFTCTRRSGTISVRSIDGDGESPFELAIFNTDGVKVESVIADSASEERSSPWDGAVGNLYRVARRQALHADRLVADLLADLPPLQRTPRRTADPG